MFCNVGFAECIKGDCNNGYGTFTWSDGAKYVGEYKDGKQHGQGTMMLPDGSKYVGGWKDGKPHGQGTATATDGDKYVGEYKDGKSQTFTKVTKSYTPTTYSYEEALMENMEQYKKTWWDSIVWFFEDLFESDESEKDKEIAELRKRIKRLESNRGTANEIRELKKCVQDISMGLPCYPY